MERLQFALVVHPEPNKLILVVSDSTEIDFANLDGLAAQIALVDLSGPGMPVEHPVPAHCPTAFCKHGLHTANPSGMQTIEDPQTLQEQMSQ
jgi:hypothetical protein